ADRNDAIAAQALAFQVLSDRIRAPFGEFLVEVGGPRAIRMARYLDHRLLVFLEHDVHRVEDAVKTRIELGTRACEGDVPRHVESDVVTDARHADTRAGQLATQLAFLAVHVITDRAPGKRADSRAYERILTMCGGIATRQQA